MSCNVCEAIRQSLETKIGRRVSKSLIDEILGVKYVDPKPCNENGCTSAYYAKGMCYRHYMATRRGPKIERSKVCSKCSYPTYAKGFCHGHYMEARWYAKQQQVGEVTKTRVKETETELLKEIEKGLKQEQEQEIEQDAKLSEYQESMDKNENEKSEGNQ